MTNLEMDNESDIRATARVENHAAAHIFEIGIPLFSGLIPMVVQKLQMDEF